MTSNDIVNQALQMCGDNIPPVSGERTFDDSTAGKALQKLYTPYVHRPSPSNSAGTLRATTSARAERESSASRLDLRISLSFDGGRGAASATRDHRRSKRSVAHQLVGRQFTRFHRSDQGHLVNQQNALAVVNNAPTEATWDPLFREAVARLLASELADALAGKPDTAERFLQSAAAFESLGEGRPG